MLHDVTCVVLCDATMLCGMFTSDGPHQTLAWSLYLSNNKMKFKNITMHFSFT